MTTGETNNSYTPCAVKSRPLNVALEVERDKCIASGYNRVPADTACDRYRSNSAEGRPFDRYLDLSYNQAPRTFNKSPHQLRGQPLNIATEVERGRRIAEGQRRLSPPAKRGTLDYNQFSRFLSDTRNATEPADKPVQLILKCCQLPWFFI